MSVIAELAAGAADACAVCVDTSQPVSALVAGVHAALALPRAVDDYEMVVRGDAGDDAGDITLHGNAGLEEVGIAGCEERVVVKIRQRVVARERLEAAGIRVGEGPMWGVQELHSAVDEHWRGAGAARVRDLLTAGAVTRRYAEQCFVQAIWRASRTGDVAFFDWLWDLAQEQHLLAALKAHTMDRWLYAAAEAGASSMIRRAVAAGADVNPGPNANPLLRAVACVKADAVATLVELDADVNVMGVYGDTPLRLAVEAGCRRTVRMLLDAEAQVDPTGQSGDTALIAAVSDADAETDVEIITLLLSRGAAVNVTGLDGDTAVMRAALAGDAALVELLASHGADVNIPNARGRTPLDVAEERGGRLESVLLALGALHGSRGDDNSDGYEPDIFQ